MRAGSGAERSAARERERQQGQGHGQGHGLEGRTRVEGRTRRAPGHSAFPARPLGSPAPHLSAALPSESSGSSAGQARVAFVALTEGRR